MYAQFEWKARPFRPLTAARKYPPRIGNWIGGFENFGEFPNVRESSGLAPKTIAASSWPLRRARLDRRVTPGVVAGHHPHICRSPLVLSGTCSSDPPPLPDGGHGSGPLASLTKYLFRDAGAGSWHAQGNASAATDPGVGSGAGPLVGHAVGDVAVPFLLGQGSDRDDADLVARPSSLPRWPFTRLPRRSRVVVQCQPAGKGALFAESGTTSTSV